MIVSVCGTAMHISEEDMDEAIDEAQDIYKEDIMKNMRKYFQGKNKIKLNMTYHNQPKLMFDK